MIFSVYGRVNWKGKMLANGIDGEFETNDERVITRLRTLGFKTVEETKIGRAQEKSLLLDIKLEKYSEENEKQTSVYRRKQK
jgi:hypothetical protein